MKHFRAVLTAASLAAGLSFATAASQAASPPATVVDAGAVLAGGSQPTPEAQDADRTPVPEPSSLALFGIGLSSYFTLRRFRKLFN